MSGQRRSDQTERDILEAAFTHAQESSAPEIPVALREHLEQILDLSYTRQKSALAVITTLILKKSSAPEQDIRLHQEKMKNGFSARGLDTQVVTPFLKANKFPAMSESGWLTRSFEQSAPYDANYPGNITPEDLKDAFLSAVDEVQSENADANDALVFILSGLITRRNASAQISLNRPIRLTVEMAANKLFEHFGEKSKGAARLPTLAIHAVYQCLVAEMQRYEDCKLLPLQSHTAADQRTGTLGDVQVNHADGRPKEVVEIKHNIPLTLSLVNDCHAKIQKTSVERFYLLSTNARIKSQEKINEEIAKIFQAHGCQMIVNGIEPTLKYYLRLLNSTALFIDVYVSLLETDPAIPYPLKEAWNRLTED